MSGARFSASRSASRTAARRPAGRRPRRAGADRRRIGQRRRQPLARAAARRRRSRCGRWRASRLPSRLAATACASVRDWRASPASMNMRRAAALALRRRERRPLAVLRHLDIGERRGRGDSLGAREAAEAVERGDAEVARDAARRRVAPIEQARRLRRRRLRRAHARTRLQRRRRGRRRRRRSARAGRSRKMSASSRSASVSATPELAGRNVDPGERAGSPPSPPPLRAATRHQVVDCRPASSSASSVSVPGVTRRTTSRLTTDLAPRFLASAGSSICSQTATRMPERDQLLQIVVGGMDRHAAHRDVGAQMLAALGQRDAERARGDLGVVEEQLVEIAHAVEQQVIRIGRLDLEILLHHRRGARSARRPCVGARRSSFMALASAVSRRRDAATARRVDRQRRSCNALESRRCGATRQPKAKAPPEAGTSAGIR